LTWAASSAARRRNRPKREGWIEIQAGAAAFFSTSPLQPEVRESWSKKCGGLVSGAAPCSKDRSRGWREEPSQVTPWACEASERGKPACGLVVRPSDQALPSKVKPRGDWDSPCRPTPTEWDQEPEEMRGTAPLPPPKPRLDTGKPIQRCHTASEGCGVVGSIAHSSLTACDVPPFRLFGQSPIRTVDNTVGSRWT
jgi:hypothetical protein